MINLSNRSIRLIVMAFVLFALAFLSSCRRVEPTSSSTFPYVEEPPLAGDVGTDDIGEYTIGSTKGIQDESGFMLKIEERVYGGLAKSRFIVTQRNLGLRAQSVGMKAVNFFAYQGGTQVNSDTIVTNALLSSADINYQSALSNVAFTSELYDYYFDDSLELLNAKENLAKKACGVIKLGFADETFDPIVLDTCYHPSGPSSE